MGTTSRGSAPRHAHAAPEPGGPWPWCRSRRSGRRAAGRGPACGAGHRSTRGDGRRLGAALAAPRARRGAEHRRDPGRVPRERAAAAAGRPPAPPSPVARPAPSLSASRRRRRAVAPKSGPDVVATTYPAERRAPSAADIADTVFASLAAGGARPPRAAGLARDESAPRARRGRPGRALRAPGRAAPLAPAPAPRAPVPRRRRRRRRRRRHARRRRAAAPPPPRADSLQACRRRPARRRRAQEKLSPPAGRRDQSPFSPCPPDRAAPPRRRPRCRPGRPGRTPRPASAAPPGPRAQPAPKRSLHFEFDEQRRREAAAGPPRRRRRPPQHRWPRTSTRSSRATRRRAHGKLSWPRPRGRGRRRRGAQYSRAAAEAGPQVRPQGRLLPRWTPRRRRPPPRRRRGCRARPTDRFDGAPTEIPSGSPRAARKPAAASPAAEEAPAPKKRRGRPEARCRRRGRRAQEGRGPPAAAGRKPAAATPRSPPSPRQARRRRRGRGRAERLAQVQPENPKPEGSEPPPLRSYKRRRPPTILPPAGHARRPEAPLMGPSRFCPRRSWCASKGGTLCWRFSCLARITWRACQAAHATSSGGEARRAAATRPRTRRGCPRRRCRDSRRRGGGRGRGPGNGRHATTTSLEPQRRPSGRASSPRRTQGCRRALPPTPRQPRDRRRMARPEDSRRRARAERDEGQDAAQFAPAQHEVPATKTAPYKAGPCSSAGRPTAHGRDRSRVVDQSGPCRGGLSVSARVRPSPSSAVAASLNGASTAGRGAGADAQAARRGPRDRLGRREVLDEFVEASEDHEARGQRLGIVWQRVGACCRRGASGLAASVGCRAGLRRQAVSQSIDASRSRQAGAVQCLRQCVPCDTNSALFARTQLRTVRNREQAVVLAQTEQSLSTAFFGAPRVFLVPGACNILARRFECTQRAAVGDRT